MARTREIVTGAFDKRHDIIRNAKKRGKVLIPDALITVAVGCFLAMAADWLFGEEYASRQQAKVIAPVAGYLYGTSHRDDITVLLIDEVSLEKAGITWPAPYAYHARLLRAIGRHDPKAVFVDIYFKDNRKAADIGLLVREICALKARGVNVYLGATQDKTKQFTLRPELEEKAGECFKKVALYFTPDEVDKTAWSYPVSPYKQAESSTAVVNTAAVEMYNGLAKTPLVLKGSGSNLALTWGAREAEHGIAWTVPAENNDSSSAYCRSAQTWREMAPGGLRGFMVDHPEKPICVFHETLLAQDLATNSAEEEKTVHTRIRGKTVMVGSSFAESRDYIVTPLHGRIPGVYLHAMALDNLLTYGENYREEVNLHFVFDTSHARLFGFLVFAILLIVTFKTALESLKKTIESWFDRPADYVKRNWLEAKSWGKKWGLALAYGLIRIFEKLFSLLLLTVVTGIAALIGTFVFQIGFISTFSVAMFIAAAEWFEIRKKLFEEFAVKSGSQNSHTTPTKGQA